MWSTEPVYDDFLKPKRRNGRSRYAHNFIAVRRHGRSHPVDKSSVPQRHSPTWPFPLVFARAAIHQSAGLLAHVGDSVMGLVLSLEVFCNLGSSLLLFGSQLFDSRCGGPTSSTHVANDGPGGKRYRCTDVRTLRELPVCNSDPARGARRPGTSRPARWHSS